MYIDPSFQWFFIGEVLKWLLMLSACFFGARLVRASERKRARLRPGRSALQRRVRELERQTEETGARLQQLVEAERFASALRLRPAVDTSGWQTGTADRPPVDSYRRDGC